MILTVTRLLKEQVALLEFHDPLIVVHKGGDFLRQLEGQGLEASGLGPMHHHRTSGLIKRGLKKNPQTPLKTIITCTISDPVLLHIRSTIKLRG